MLWPNNGGQMKATDKYRAKYAKKLIDQGQPIKRLRTPAGHEDINRLCDAVEKLYFLVNDCVRAVDGPFKGKAQNRLNMILLGL